MSLDLEILGGPGRDNALLVRVEAGHRTDRLLFDCGAGCVSSLELSEVQKIDHLFFSHLHMDHVAGFDDFFRANYARDSRPNVVWGPAGTARIIHHRLRGYWWNLCEGREGSWVAHDVNDGVTSSARFDLADAFEARHELPAFESSGEKPEVILSTKELEVEAVPLEHHGPCLGWVVRERDRKNIATDRLAAAGLRPGPWLQVIKDEASTEERVEIDGKQIAVADLRKELLVTSAGSSVAYLTDFFLEDERREEVAERIRGVDTLVSEAQYRHSDLELAKRNAHMTTVRVAELARAARVSELVLFHLSGRYSDDGWREMLDEAQELFPKVGFPASWELS